MLRGAIAGIAGVAAVVLIGGYKLLKSGLVPANADANPGGIELWIASTSEANSFRVPGCGVGCQVRVSLLRIMAVRSRHHQERYPLGS